MKATPRSYLGVAITMNKLIPEWISMETKEFTPFSDGTIRHCTNRPEVVVDKGSLTSQGDIVSPLPSMFVANRAVYYHPVND